MYSSSILIRHALYHYGKFFLGNCIFVWFLCDHYWVPIFLNKSQWRSTCWYNKFFSESKFTFSRISHWPYDIYWYIFYMRLHGSILNYVFNEWLDYFITKRFISLFRELSTTQLEFLKVSQSFSTKQKLSLFPISRLINSFFLQKRGPQLCLKSLFNLLIIMCILQQQGRKYSWYLRPYVFFQ